MKWSFAKKLLLILYAILFSIPTVFAADLKKVSGYIKDKLNEETLIGATIYIKELEKGVSSNNYGYFCISVPPGEFTLQVTYIGYKGTNYSLNVQKDTSINVSIDPLNSIINTFVLSSGNDKKENLNLLGTVNLNPPSLSVVPSLFGENDILKMLQQMPGIQTIVEGASSFSVRGGGRDQNLIMLDDAPVYNVSHMMGFFSAFNTDAIKNAILYKGDIPASAGGRLSSFLEISSKDGDKNSFITNGSVGLISSRLSFEGPITQKKGSFFIAARTTYADKYLPLSNDSTIRKNKVSFYDLNGKINYQLNANNKVYLSLYNGRDNSLISNLYRMYWQNSIVSARWNHIYNQNLFSNLTLYYTSYNYNLKSIAFDPVLTLTSQIREYSLKYDFTYYLKSYILKFIKGNNSLKFGLQSSYRDIQPKRLATGDNVSPNNQSTVHVLENALYLLNEKNLGVRFYINYGFRISSFHNIGPTSEYQINTNDYTISDTTYHRSRSIYHSYLRLEPRISLKFHINNNSYLKAAYSRTNQYLQQVSSSTSGTPFDVWLPASAYISPLKADQVDLGYIYSTPNGMYRFTAELYYKKMYHLLEFVDNSDLFEVKSVLTQLRFGQGKSYGLELFARKSSGVITGWISYTLSAAKRQFAEINKGITFNADYDHPNNFNISISCKVSQRIDFNAQWIYYTGTPITYPSMRFYWGGKSLPYYEPGTRNQWRLPDYHRLDLSLTLRNKRKAGRKWESQWVAAVYNVYNRENPYSVFFEVESSTNQLKAYKMVMLPIIPSLSYTFKF